MKFLLPIPHTKEAEKYKAKRSFNILEPISAPDGDINAWIKVNPIFKDSIPLLAYLST